MRLQIRHFTRYTYSEPVFLQRQALNLRPATNAAQRLLEFELAIDPAPSGQATLVDLEMKDTLSAWFDGITDHLEITATSTVETLRPNPFDYVWEGAQSLPMHYAPILADALVPYRQIRVSPAAEAMAAESAAAANGDAQEFLRLLADQMHQRFRRIIRLEGEPWPPEETIARGEGSCRDLTVLYMEIAQAQGFACRFATGYFALEEAREFDLHAWAEVYVPGGGWRGFDPMHGLAVADRHVAVAFGRRPEQAMTVTGAFNGRATSDLDTKVEISELS